MELSFIFKFNLRLFYYKQWIREFMASSVCLRRLSIGIYTVAFSLIKINFASILEQLLAARTRAPLAVAYTVWYWQPSKCTVGDKFLLILSHHVRQQLLFLLFFLLWSLLLPSRLNLICVACAYLRVLFVLWHTQRATATQDLVHRVDC